LLFLIERLFENTHPIPRDDRRQAHRAEHPFLLKESSKDKILKRGGGSTSRKKREEEKESMG